MHEAPAREGGYGTFQGGLPSRRFNAGVVYSICLVGAVLVIVAQLVQTTRATTVEQYDSPQTSRSRSSAQ